MPGSQSSPAIILRTRRYGEVDVIVTFLTRDFGKLTGIAKGAKNSRRRFANCLEPFARVRAHFRSRPGASLVFLERCELLHPAAAMAHPSRLAYGSYLVELVDRLTHEANPIGEVHTLLEQGLEQIERGPATATLLRAFELQLLRDLGYAPPLHHCGRCGGPFEGAADAFFDPAQALFLCHQCGERHRAGERFTASTFAALARLQQLPLAHCSAEPLPPEAARQAAGLTATLLGSHLSRPLRSLELIASLAREGG